MLRITNARGSEVTLALACLQANALKAKEFKEIKKILGSREHAEEFLGLGELNKSEFEGLS